MSDKFAICEKCHKIIKLLKGSHHWTLVSTYYPSECKTHEPLVTTFESSYDANKIKKRALAEYWNLPEGEHEDFYKAWAKSVKIALKELGYVTA